MDPNELSGGSDFLADSETGKVENGCSGKDGLFYIYGAR
jgi:hypothetical protein